MPPTAYPEVNVLLEDLAVRLQLRLGDGLLALYLYGSTVTGGFHPDASDVDLLAVTSESVDSPTFDVLRRMHAALEADHPAWRDRIEVQYVSFEALRTFKERASQIAAISPGEPLCFKAAGSDWAHNWYDVQENGRTIVGPPASSFVPHITRGEFVRAIVAYASELRARGWGEPRHRGAEAYDAVTMCRALYSAVTGKQISKAAAAAWVAAQWPDWAGAITTATCFREDFGNSDLPCDSGTAAELGAFVAAAAREIGG